MWQKCNENLKIVKSNDRRNTKWQGLKIAM